MTNWYGYKLQEPTAVLNTFHFSLLICVLVTCIFLHSSLFGTYTIVWLLLPQQGIHKQLRNRTEQHLHRSSGFYTGLRLITLLLARALPPKNNILFHLITMKCKSNFCRTSFENWQVRVFPFPHVVIPSDGWRYGQRRQSKCPDHPPAYDCCALQNRHAGK